MTMTTTHHPTPMKITVGYDLPFRVSASTTSSELLRIRVRCKPGTRPKALLQLQTHVAIFLEAALFGMGAGPHVPPRLDRRSIDDVLRVSTNREEVVLDVPCAVDPSYVTVLLHKLLGLAEHVPIEEVAVELPGLAVMPEPVPVERGETSALPEAHLPLPFAFEDERSGHADGCTVSISYVEPPNEDALEVLREGLRVFVAQALQGGFISPPMGPDDYFVSADDDVAVHADEVTWTMESCDFAPDGLDGLLNFLAAYHHGVAALREVVLE
jgi:hypothetical protein